MVDNLRVKKAHPLLRWLQAWCVAAAAGTLPACWADVGSFPQLTVLGIQSGTKMSGTLPPEWGSPTAFQQLRYLYVVECPITGELPIIPLSSRYQASVFCLPELRVLCCKQA